MVLHAVGVRLITFDRPGYGESERQEFRQVADVVWLIRPPDSVGSS
jgi:hypothetical protein